MQVGQTLAHLKSNPFEKKVRPTVDVRYDGMNHWPQYGEKKNRCKFCKFGYTFLYCAKCNMHLCLLPNRNCFKAFHVK
ncbi:hypothetical protein MRX96_036709 [Rhipicephalus microplus]